MALFVNYILYRAVTSCQTTMIPAHFYILPGLVITLPHLRSVTKTVLIAFDQEDQAWTSYSRKINIFILSKNRSRCSPISVKGRIEQISSWFGHVWTSIRKAFTLIGAVPLIICKALSTTAHREALCLGCQPRSPVLWIVSLNSLFPGTQQPVSSWY